MARSTASTVVWMVVLWLFAVGLTVAGFLSFILPEYRGLTFYSVLVFSCFAEAVMFGYLAYLLTVPHTVKRPSHATRNRIMVAVVIWFLLVMTCSSIAVIPSVSDTFFSDKVVLFLMILTFFLLLSAYFMTRQDVVIQERTDAPERERVQIQSYAGGVETWMASLREVVRRVPQRAMELDGVLKRMDTLKSQLDSVPPHAERDRCSWVEPATAVDLAAKLRILSDAVRELADGEDSQIEEAALQVRQATDDAIAALRHREDTLAR